MKLGLSYIIQLAGAGALVVGLILDLHHLAPAICMIGGAAAVGAGWYMRKLGVTKL